jgi:hypothetical protein
MCANAWVTVHEMLGKDFVEAVIFDWREAG